MQLDRAHTIADVVAVSRERAPVALSEAALNRLARSRSMLERLIADGRPMYGVTTGVGALSETAVTASQAARMSENVILSHACGVGVPLDEAQARAIMFCAVLNFCQGVSGIRPQTVQRIVDFLNRGVTPWIPSQGGMGSLTHMAHVGLVLMGMGQAYVDGRLCSGAAALSAADLAPWPLREKEGLSLVNGTPSKSGLASLLVYDARQLARFADASGCMAFESLRGTSWAFDKRVHDARPHAGQRHVADNLRRLLQGSEIADRYREHRVQDALSLRAMPQVHGACRDQIEHVARIVEIELDAATDNPMIFEQDGSPLAISANNAHGEPLALGLDGLCLALSELACIAERRIDRMLNHHVSELPPFLVRQAGLNSGLMIPQYVAASLVAENKVLCHPVSVDSIPTTSLQEDHWSMATPAALKAWQVLRNAQKVIAIELLVAAQALEFHRPLRAGRGTECLYALVRTVVPSYDEDRVLYPDLHRLIAEVEIGRWIFEIAVAVGDL